MRFKDLTGQKFGRWTVIKFVERRGRVYYWLCRCECGTERIVRSSSLINGESKSCGCFMKESSREIGYQNRTHGLTNTTTHHVWSSIKARCFNPNHQQFKDYGGRGITMYEPWINDFKAFYDYVSKLEHFGEGGYTLDRINNNGNYEPGNLRWATGNEQRRNQRSNIWVEYGGEQMILKDAAEKLGITYLTLYKRYQCGDRGDRLFRPVKERR